VALYYKSVAFCDGYGPYYDRHVCDNKVEFDIKIGKASNKQASTIPLGWLELDMGEFMCPACVKKMSEGI
jgi:uncharacterized protein (UPF0212 family)